MKMPKKVSGIAVLIVGLVIAGVNSIIIYFNEGEPHREFLIISIILYIVFLIFFVDHSGEDYGSVD